MKSVKILLSVALAVVGVVAMAQDFSDDAKYGKYGATPEERKDNIYLLNFFNEAVGNQDFQTASGYLKQLLDKCPKASENIYAKGATVMKNKIARAKSVAEKKTYIDSLMLLYDLRIENFGDHATRGKAYILDRKARDFLIYNPLDHERVLELFREAIAAQPDPELVAIYFKQLTDYYKDDGEGSPEEIIAEYDRLSPVFDGATGQAAEYKDQFDKCFGLSGVARSDDARQMRQRVLSDYRREILRSEAVGRNRVVPRAGFPEQAGVRQGDQVSDRGAGRRDRQCREGEAAGAHRRRTAGYEELCRGPQGRARSAGAQSRGRHDLFRAGAVLRRTGFGCQLYFAGDVLGGLRHDGEGRSAARRGRSERDRDQDDGRLPQRMALEGGVLLQRSAGRSALCRQRHCDDGSLHPLIRRLRRWPV